eukprot:167550_1
MSIIPLLYIAVFIFTGGDAKKVTKEWMFHFDAQNQKNWDNYQITSHDAKGLHGQASGCTSRFPVVFKKLCVDWNQEDGFSFNLNSAHNLNIDKNYDDMLWFYGDHDKAQKAEKAAKAKQTTDEGSRRRLITENEAQCYWYGDARACARIDEDNPNAMSVSVGVNGDHDGYFGAKEDEYGEYYDEQDDDEYDDLYDDYDDYEDVSYDDNDGFDAANEDYNEYEEYYNELYDYLQNAYDNYAHDDDDYAYDDDGSYYNQVYDADAMYQAYQQQALYNQQWANYWQNLYWQNMLQQQQYWANAYGYGGGGGEGDKSSGFGDMESSVMQKAESEARKNVESKLEKKMEGRFESKFEKEMMNNMGGSHESVHPKRSSYQYRTHHHETGGSLDDAVEHHDDAEEQHEMNDGDDEMPPAGLINM